MSPPLEFTGERFVPGAHGEIWYEHWHRYHFASALVAGLDVLDVACGEGYGSALLARTARRVTGADVAADAVLHARARYAHIANVEFRQADATALPFADASFDAVVSFETIEHLAAQAVFLDEVRRVLRAGGFLVLSCPNRVEYSEKRGVKNAFHVHEPDRAELAAILAARFPHVAWHGQRPGFFSVIWPDDGEARGQIFEVSETDASAGTPGHARPMYFIVVASATPVTLDAAAPRLSVLADRDEWIYRNYEDVTRAYMALETSRAARDAEIAAARDLAERAARERDTLRAALAESDAERARIAAKAAALENELARRAGLRGWLAVPLRKLRKAFGASPPSA